MIGNRRVIASGGGSAVLLASACLVFLSCSASAQMVTGRDMPGYAKTFGLDTARQARNWEVRQTAIRTGKSEGANVLWPGETPRFTFRFTNKTGQPLRATGKLEIIPYGTSVQPGDIWVPHVFPLPTPAKSVPLQVVLPANGSKEITLTPEIPARFGGYALIADLGAEGRAFAATLVRVPEPEPGRVQYPTFALDMGWPHEVSEATSTLFERLGIKGCRMGAGYSPTTQPDFEQRNQQFEQHLRWAEKHQITVMLTVGEGGAPQPLGRPRPWLSPDGVMLDTKSDYAWLPEYDPDFQQWSRLIASRYGWPRGPVNAIELWNEPWEGISISGWGADLPRFRELYLCMAKGIEEARQKDGVEVLIGGACSSSNTRDKLFCDGTDFFLPYLDFVSIHYQPLSADPALEKSWVNRKGKYGPVRVWDTESWVANSEDRIAGVIASMRAQGQSRTAGIYGGNVFHSEILSDTPRLGIAQAWSPAAAVAASQKFIGQRPFKEILFKNGLPWVFCFDGLRPDDGTLVILGDLGAVYEQTRCLFRSVQSKLPREGGSLTLSDGGGEFVLFDFYGNPVPSKNGRITVPLNGLGYFLRTRGAKGAFERLVNAVATARIIGYPPVEILAHDFTAADQPLRLTLTNILNIPVQGKLTGKLTGKLGGATLPVTAVSLKPHETRVLELPVRIAASPANAYPLEVALDASREGKATHTETLHINSVLERTITVDGDLKDWEGALPQTATADLGVSLTEKAYLPFQNFDARTSKGVATGYLAADRDYFYFAAKIADDTPYPGNIRFARRNDDDYYYPEKSFVKATAGSAAFSARWSGKIAVPATGRYRLITVSDDGVRLWVNGRQVVDNWTDHGPTENDTLLDLKAGENCEVRMEYYQGGGGAVARLHWETPDGKRVPVPGPFTAQLYKNRDLSGEPVVTRSDKTVDFEWGGGDLPDPKFGESPLEELTWPAGVRRFSYRKDPDLPSGNGTDNVQIAFNVFPQEKKSWLPFVPGTMPWFMVYEDTDYEFALNQVAEVHGGGTEIWCLQKPGMGRKHFYPRQPAAPADGGPVPQGKLTMRRDGNTRIVECAIPWSQMPEVREKLLSGQAIKFSYRINDNQGAAYELASGRSVSKDNPRAFHNDWATHWANELEFRLAR